MKTQEDRIDRTVKRIKNTGEVFTPKWLIDEMIDTLEIDWSNPPQDKTFLDPTCGNGNFLVALAERNIPLKNIYGVDLMEDNVKLTKERLQGGFEGNILCRDAVTYDYSFGDVNILDVGDVGVGKKFDYVLTNPPYQMPIGEGSKTKSIWAGLISKFHGLVKDKGIMSSIHPGGWRFVLPRSKKDIKAVREIYCSNRILYMELNSYKKGKATFGAGTDYDVITLIKEASNGDCFVKMELDGIQPMNIKEMGMIPTDMLSLFEKLKWIK